MKNQLFTKELLEKCIDKSLSDVKIAFMDRDGSVVVTEAKYVHYRDDGKIIIGVYEEEF